MANAGPGSPQAEELPPRAASYPLLRYMGSKHRLLPWIHGVLRTLDFETAADPFVGGGCVAYLLKAMGKSVVASDFLNFPTVLAAATVANSHARIDGATLEKLLSARPSGPRFIEETFAGIFFAPDDLRFLDRVAANLEDLDDAHLQALARSALIRSCLKKQPRGVFTISGDLSRHDDGRRDLRLSLEEHFVEQVAIFNRLVFDNGRPQVVQHADVFDLEPAGLDLVYLDPPYVPRSDDNCYMKRYHFLEGLSCYWRGMTVMHGSRVKKLPKPYTPFSYRKTAADAFDRLFAHFRGSTIVLSYSSNGFPDLSELERLLARYKGRITVHEKLHRYHFGTHGGVARAVVSEYLLVGR
ncbi:D12 class N6 adenine-specific DNA methyltransferase [Aquisphaera giovannonii]|uniref:site-specific DNA-methyltransferase (adenine-specific) n=1 Tax=Aquisphaera giovannonii TaxID=406548 RepID=A0A5B9VX96_9BACT|nr:DNA adenine methylase [Aquisphaera giovannonii]QEH32739.1 D12 class N6 adenine-specific DNA methyltransferase [Aquisphaera giovannonii]